MPIALSDPAARTTVRRTDLEHLQGIWCSIAGRHQARLLIAGRRFAFEFLDGDLTLYMGSFSLDPAADPKRMDMHIDEGPESYKGHIALCLYHLDSDILRWCPAKPGATVRLSQFPHVDDDRYLSMVFKRQRPHRPH